MTFRKFAWYVLAGCLASAVCSTLAAKVIPYPRPPGDLENGDYTVIVDGQRIDSIATTMEVGYAHFAFTGKVRVEIESREKIDSFDLSPHRLKIPARAKGNRLTFELTRPCKLHLRINELPRFFIFAEAPDQDVPDVKAADVHLLTDFGVVSSPHVTQTRQIQQALDQVAAEWGTLYVPPGIYRSGTLTLPSNLQLYLAPGALIQGTANLADYDRGPGGISQLRLRDARNVRIFGRGVIDNNGFALRNQFLPDRNRGRAKMLIANRCRDLVVQDVILRDSAVWCVHAVESENLQFRNLKIISISRAETGPENSHNTDGFDPDNSSNVLIENNFISVDDDAIAVKLVGGKRRDMRNIVFRDNVIWTTCAALKIGTEVHDFTVRDVLFADNDVVHADSAIVVQCYRGGYVDGARWINNHFEQVGVVPNHSPHRKGADIYINSRSESSFGEIRRLSLERNTFERVNRHPSMIRAAGARQMVDGVTIERLIIAGEKRLTADAAGIKIDRDAEHVTFR